MQKLSVLDTTLRDGCQGVKISYTVQDRLKIISLLDDFGVTYIELGNPTYSPKDAELFSKLKSLNLKNSRLACFGATRRIGKKAEEDSSLKSIAESVAPAAVIFGKAWDLHVTDILGTDLSENLSMIYDSARFLADHGKEVIFDAEHFFDGYKNNPDYALAAVGAAYDAGASTVCLCDTNGGAFPDEIESAVAAVRKAFGREVGIHAHNDGAMAVSNSIFAVNGGATHVQGTMIGTGERCGNANLSAVIANLQLKRGFNIVPDISALTYTCRAISDISNLSMRDLPYVGKNAFSHKAGTHIDGVMKNPSSFEHIDPETVGNDRTFLMSDFAGKSAAYSMMKKIIPGITKDSPEIAKVLARLKELEFKGYQFEGAPASFELEIRRVLNLNKKEFFHLDRLRLLIEQDSERDTDGYSSAYIKVFAGGEEEITACDSSSGPVNAMDSAIRKALERFYPEISAVRLTDYKVRVIDSDSATRAMVRVMIESSDSESSWTTVGVSKDVIMASKKALLDSIEYYLIKHDKSEG